MFWIKRATVLFITTVLFVVIMEKLLLEAITHIKSISKNKSTTERLLTYINKSSATKCDEAITQDTLCILRTKDLLMKT